MGLQQRAKSWLPELREPKKLVPSPNETLESILRPHAANARQLSEILNAGQEGLGRDRTPPSTDSRRC